MYQQQGPAQGIPMGQPVQGQPMYGQPMYGQPMQGQPMQGQPMQGQPMQGQQMQGQQMEPTPGMEYMDPNKPFVNIAETPDYVRSDFIRKVYSILSVQLLVTFAIAYYMNTQLSPAWVVAHKGFFYMASMGTLVLMLGVSCCCQWVTRQFPLNYLFLAAITLGISLQTGLATLIYTTDSVLLALATTAVVFCALTAYACLTKSDFTGMGPYLMGALLCLICFGLLMNFWTLFTGQSLAGSPVHMLYAGVGVLIFVLYIIYDTQLIVGGRHKKHQFSVDDYVCAALNIYLDIINLFLLLLELMGDRR